MDDYLKEQTLEKISNAQNIQVLVSSSSNFDGLASGLSIYLSVKKLGKNVSIFAKDPTVSDAQNLYGVGKIGNNEGRKDLVISVANAVENVDKVTYFLEGNQLKVVIHAFADSRGVDEKDLTFQRTASRPDLIFAIGYLSLDDLKKEITHEQSLDSEVWIISINKQELKQNFAQVNIHEHEAGSLSEVCTNIFQDLAFPIDEDIAYNLYAGILSATKRFSPSLAKPSTFEAAEWLVKFGAGKASFAQKAAQTTQPQVSEIRSQNPMQPRPATFRPPIPVSEKSQTPVEEVEAEKRGQESWLKPPKIYRGSKSFDSES